MWEGLLGPIKVASGIRSHKPLPRSSLSGPQSFVAGIFAPQDFARKCEVGNSAA